MESTFCSWKISLIEEKLKLFSFIFPTIKWREKDCHWEINADDLGKDHVIIMMPHTKFLHSYWHLTCPLAILMQKISLVYYEIMFSLFQIHEIVTFDLYTE